MISDGKIRDAIRDETARSVVVEASAGTGKTTLLTDRVAALVQSGIPLESLAVVTFTEAAASELRMRIREKIPRESRNKMDRAWIHTIHGFASRLLKEYYHLRGGVPEFTVEASHFSRSELEVLWDIFLASQTGDNLEAASEAMRYPGSGVLLDAVAQMEKHRWLLNTSPLGNTEKTAEILKEHCISRLKHLENSCTDKSDRLCGQIASAVDLLNSGITDVKIPTNCGSQAAWGGKEGKEEAKAEIKSCMESLEDLRGLELMVPMIPALDRLVFPFLNRIRTIWDEDPTRLSYDDLLYLAGQAVAASPVLSEKLSEKFSYIFIDEFQDTSLIQVRLFRDILRPQGMKSKLTVVGDPKQSIYGWRSADMETYRETVQDMEESKALSETISVNFRSAKSVIQFINSFGEALFQNTPQEETPFSSVYSPIEAAPDAVPGEGVFIHRLPKISARSKAHIYSAIQAKKIADLVKDPGSTAVLFRTKTHVDELLREFDIRGIPYRMEAGSDFHKRQEVQDTASLLRYLLQPGNTRAESETLRSMFFGVDDREITQWKLSGIESPAIRKAFDLTDSLRKTLRSLPLHLFARTLFSNTCILQSIRKSGYQSGRRLANMRYILEQTEKIADCSKLLETLEGRAPFSAEEPSAPPEESDGAVTVSTIHGAKGLAWKHVILADPGGSFAGVRNTVLTDRRKGKLGLKLKDGFSAEYPEMKNREKHRAAAEYRRLLYVAVTRPRERLDVFLQPAASENSPCGMFHSALERAKHFTCIEIGETEAETENSSFPAALPPSPGDPFRDVIDITFPDGETGRETAMRLGTEVHGLMEFIDLNDPSGWLENNGKLLKEVLEFPGKTVSLVNSFFDSFDLSGAELVGREYPIVSGGSFYYVDLLLERNGCLEAVDYKTDTGDPLARRLVYEEHQRLYRRELERATGKKVKLFLVFLHHGTVLEID